MAQINLGHVVGQGVPSGGTAGQVLKKNSSTNFDTNWTTLNSSDIPVSASDSTTVQQSLSAVKSDIGIVEDGNTATHTIAAGQYVIWKGALYIASAAIPSGTTLSTSNLTAVSDGGLNSLNANFTDNQYSTSGLYTSNCSIDAGGYHKFGKMVIVNLRIVANASSFDVTGLPAYDNILNKNIVSCSIANVGDSAYESGLFAYINRTGKLSAIGTSNKTYAISAVYMCN